MEFLIPVRYTGTRLHRVTADTLEQAIEEVSHKAEIKAHYELELDGVQTDILAPRLMLSDEDRKTWKYWEYWYTGTDGVDWRVGYTSGGIASIPDYAESSNPVPADYIESFKEGK